MILSRTSQYAIQVMIYLATRPRGEPVLNRNIARHLNVPAAYLVKVLQLLAKGKLVHSSRGRRGGYCLCDGMEKIDLMQILLLTEKEEFSRECVLGLKTCGDDTACPMHCEWKLIKQEITHLLYKQTLKKLARSMQSGKCRLADVPSSQTVRGAFRKP